MKGEMTASKSEFASTFDLKVCTLDFLTAGLGEKETYLVQLSQMINGPQKNHQTWPSEQFNTMSWGANLKSNCDKVSPFRVISFFIFWKKDFFQLWSWAKALILNANVNVNFNVQSYQNQPRWYDSHRCIAMCPRVSTRHFLVQIQSEKNQFKIAKL